MNQNRLEKAQQRLRSQFSAEHGIPLEATVGQMANALLIDERGLSEVAGLAGLTGRRDASGVLLYRTNDLPKLAQVIVNNITKINWSR
jgi:hypothetical protein